MAKRTTALLAVLGAAMPASADATAPPARAHLSLRAPAGCASEAAIAAGVRARSTRIAFVGAADDVPNLRVELRAERTSELVAALTVHWPDGRRSERRVAAEGCADAVEALAFLIVLTLDPRSQPGSPAASVTRTLDEPYARLRFDRVELGLIAPTATGRDTFAAQSRSRLWLDWGATLALQADLGSVMQVGVNAGLLVPSITA